MTTPALLRPMTSADPAALVRAFAPLGWPGKDADLFEGYLAAQQRGEKAIVVAVVDGCVAGYVCIDWTSTYEPFRVAGIPEIVDLNVLPEWRNQGIGTALMSTAEDAAAEHSRTVGLGVGLYADYGTAWRIYVRRGYLPDGRGVMYGGRAVPPGETLTLDDQAVIMMTRQLHPGSP
jgi:GNAT superfamily N-acetyltransferase